MAAEIFGGDPGDDLHLQCGLANVAAATWRLAEVIGNLNEHGLAIGETTFGGNVLPVKALRLNPSQETLHGGEGVMDYGTPFKMSCVKGLTWFKRV